MTPRLRNSIIWEPAPQPINVLDGAAGVATPATLIIGVEACLGTYRTEAVSKHGPAPRHFCRSTAPVWDLMSVFGDWRSLMIEIACRFVHLRWTR